MGREETKENKEATTNERSGRKVRGKTITVQRKGSKETEERGKRVRKEGKKVRGRDKLEKGEQRKKW